MLYTSQFLPLTTMILDNWQLVRVSGVDSTKFLQGQLTADIAKLSDNHFLLSAQCDPKGKTLCNMLLFKRSDNIYYMVRKSVLALQLDALKKYAIFSKVTFEVEQTVRIFGVAATNPSAYPINLLPSLNNEQNCITNNDLTYLRIDFPISRYIIIGQPSDIDALPFPIDISLQQNNQQWELLDMEANYPIIDLPASNQYLPQAFNLQNFKVISFDKGCYCGQEMVARAQYRGINKRTLRLLTGQSDVRPNIGDPLEQKMGGNWRETGCILAVLNVDDDNINNSTINTVNHNYTIWVQAILNSNLDEKTPFRLKNSRYLLDLVPL